MYATKRLAVLAVLVFSSACGGGGGGGGNTPTSPVTPTTPTSPTTPTTPTAPTTTPGLNEVIATNESTFNPANLTVAKGTTVTFTFQATVHNVVFAAVAGAPANIANSSSTSVARVFATAGSFGYDCSLHPGMKGTVVVN